MATLASGYDMARFGAEVVRFSPRQSDLLICAGIVNLKMAPDLKKYLRPNGRSEMGDFNGGVRVFRWNF